MVDRINLRNHDVTRRGLIGLLAAAGTAFGSCGCSLIYPSAGLRYRMTVEVETPEGLKTGSSVIETTIHKGIKFAASGIKYDLKGEAVAVDLPGGRTLFALLRGVEQASAADYHAQLFMRLLGAGVQTVPPMPRQFHPNEWNEAFKVARQLKPMLIIPQAIKEFRPGKNLIDVTPYPMLVTFTDVADPKTVAHVDPTDLAASFEPGVALRRITLQVTDDKVTAGIEKRLGWLGKYPEPRLDPTYNGSFDPKNIGPAQSLSHGDFRKGTES